MANPILQRMNNRQNNSIGNLIQMAKGNPDAVYKQLLNSNPQFAQFVRENQGKTPEQIAQEHGIDMNMLRQLMR